MNRAAPGTATLFLAAAAALGLLCAPAVADAGAFWRSLIVPGWGQRAAGQPTAAARFLATEVLLWSGYAGARAVGDVRARTYRTYAAGHAGARPGGKGSEYFDDLGFYASQQQHNQFAVVDDGPGALLYPATPEYAWAWDSEASRQRYRRLHNGAQSMERSALYATGLVVVNHLVAAIHAGRLEGREASQGHGASQGHRARLGVSYRLGPEGLGLALSRRF